MIHTKKKEILYVPPSMRVVDLFLRMQVSRIHMALVIDEYGGTDGLVTIEDLIEQIVGEINDEHDDDEGPLVRAIKTSSLKALVAASLADEAHVLSGEPKLEAILDGESAGAFGEQGLALAGLAAGSHELRAGPGVQNVPHLGLA